jgi:hypothetical protein
MTEIEFLKTITSDEINITQNMLEDLYVVSSIYNVSIKDLIINVFDIELINNAQI